MSFKKFQKVSFFIKVEKRKEELRLQEANVRETEREFTFGIALCLG